MLEPLENLVDYYESSRTLFLTQSEHLKNLVEYNAG